MRVISGTARGTKLNSIESISTRPTLDRVKEALFNIIQTKIPNATVLDLFSGSGAISIECLSRGAQHAYLCENNPSAIKMIYANLEKTRLKEKATLIGKDYKKGLLKFSEENIAFDIIYLDPPYQANIAVLAVEKILALQLLKENGIIIIETDDEQRELKELQNYNVEVYNIKKYGRVSLIFIKESD